MLTSCGSSANVSEFRAAMPASAIGCCKDIYQPKGLLWRHRTQCSVLPTVTTATSQPEPMSNQTTLAPVDRSIFTPHRECQPPPAAAPQPGSVRVPLARTRPNESVRSATRTGFLCLFMMCIAVHLSPDHMVCDNSCLKLEARSSNLAVRRVVSQSQGDHRTQSCKLQRASDDGAHQRSTSGSTATLFLLPELTASPR